MLTLSPAAFNRARTYILTHARPLEQALFRYHFEHGSAEDARAELARFRNPDYGFGHGLEADMQSPLSSALAAKVALDHLLTLQTPGDHPYYLGLADWLRKNFDQSTLTWRALPDGTQSAPHAPWWNDADGSLEKTFDHFLIMPRAGLAAQLWHLPGLVSREWLVGLTASIVNAVETSTTLPQSGDSLEYALELLAAPDLPAHLHQRLEEHLKEIVPNSIAPTPEEWRSYSIEPLKLAAAPQSPAARWIPRDLIHANLDFRIEAQTEAGCWEPNWSWFGQYTDVWQSTALPAWRGVVTLNNLLILRSWKRLA